MWSKKSIGVAGCNRRLEVMGWVVGLFLFQAPSLRANELGLKAYLEQVRGSNGAYQGSVQLHEAAALYKGEAQLIYRPRIFASYAFSDDQRPTSQPAFMGDQTVATKFDFGVAQVFATGTSAKLYYSLMGARVRNAPVLPMPNFATGAPTLEVSQSLWKNRWGRETQAQYEAIEAQGMAVEFVERFKARAKLMEAEMTFYRLATARQVVAIQRSLVERAKKMLEWTSRRARLNLGDQSDRLQSEAALQERLLDLTSALNEERSASRFFNTFRGQDSDQVSETIPGLVSAQLLAEKPNPRGSVRDDVSAEEQRSRAGRAGAQIAREKTLPDLDIMASYSINSREASEGDAVSKSFEGRYPNYAVQLRFSMPLGGDLESVRGGRDKEIEAVDRSLQYKKVEVENEWKDLEVKLVEAQSRLKLTEDLAKLQEQKLAYERDRLLRGRTTTYQVLLFETDYGRTELARLRAQNDVVRLLAQMKLFGSEI